MRPCHKHVQFEPKWLTRDHDYYVHRHWDRVFVRKAPLYGPGVVYLMDREVTGPTMTFNDAQFVEDHVSRFNSSGVKQSLFAYNYEAMRANMIPLRRELLAVVMHPSRLSKLGLYDDDAAMP
jgi:hypothetical protein